MAAFSQEIALQWELGGEDSLFTVEDFDTGLEHSDSGNHVAGTARFLIAHFTSEVIAGVFKVGPIEVLW
jgi:hypothetical protein